MPASGREGDAPEWPLSDPTDREVEIWEEVWDRPQALMWEANSQELEVAMFVRALKDAEKADAAVSARTLVRQQMDSLGMTVPGMRSNRWQIVAEDGSKVEVEDVGQSVRDRLRVVQGEGA